MSEPAFQSVCGRVRAMPPTAGKGYWRLEYVQYGRRRQLSGGRTLESARRKMALILIRLDAELDEDRGRTIGDAVLDAWLAPGQPHRGGRPWSEGTRVAHSWYANRYLRPVLGCLPVEQWTRREFRAIVQQAPTRKEGVQVRRRLSAMLGWGLTAGYVSEAQVVALRAIQWTAPPGYVERPARLSPADDESGIVDDVMDAATLDGIGDALQRRYEHGKLFAEFAAATGLRRGELFAVRDRDVDLGLHRVRVAEQFNAQTGSRTLPKMGRRRTAVFMAGPTITGFGLATSLGRRVAAARDEPNGLLFPAPRGGHWDATNFYKRVWLPAMDDAGISYVEDGDRRLYRYTCHSLRDRFAVSALNEWGWELDELRVAGGWANAQIVFSRYYGVVRDVLDRLTAKAALG